ncbi:hypothetical protein Micbo1qcDRAFT_171989 [Microdochium bolleyi]|uniref:LYC1 C-terminal domain-containing protein n=1 Tax=Microdochium bolleyi TaxID=196109 RepID=A0A136JET4_9PEZI|nr:hypothetical protein Micbo1qcDRAFT_171989 [Microdochium bolleyi]
MADLPAATSPSVVLAHPTDDEKRQTWALTAAEWAGALTLDQYLEREPYLTTIPVSRDGGMTHWILTTNDDNGSSGSSERPLLSSCESIMKTVLVASPEGDGQVTEEIGHGIGSVYTSPEFRGRSYASRMLAEVGVQLENWDLAPQEGTATKQQQQQQKKKKKAICSALWSDIGKKFYAKKGWIPFASQHIEFPAGHHHDSTAKAKGLTSTPITYDNLAGFCALDEAALRERLSRTARETGKTVMAFAPSHDQMLWHLYRDSYIASIVFPDRDPHLADDPIDNDKDNTITNTNGSTNGSTNGGRSGSSSSSSPTRQPRSGDALRRHPGKLEANEVKGIAVGKPGRRVWAFWTRNYSKGPESPKDNTLYILRLTIENEEQYDAHSEQEKQELADSLVAVIRAAQATAQEWSCGRVDLWNPDGLVARLLLRDSGLEHEVVEREESSIPSLMWYGAGTKTEDAVWLCNEKYAWC